VHEVVNAILHRPDSESFNIPVGVIPAGTSNGLAKAICDSANEDCNPLVCAYFCVKGQTKDIDLLEIETISSQTKIYSFLSIAYGFIADVDLESEV
jgi:diacylglycerol kinase family enzyme